MLLAIVPPTYFIYYSLPRNLIHNSSITQTDQFTIQQNFS